MFRTARLPRRAVVRASLALVASAALLVTGCGAGQYAQTANQVAAIDGSNGSAGDVHLLNVRLAATDKEKYPAGSNARVLAWISNNGLNPDTLTKVSTPVATSVKISGDGSAPGQSLVDFATDKGAQITVNGFKQDQHYGVSIPMTFSFATAGDITVNVPVEVPAERSGTRQTVAILPAHPTPIWEQGAHGEGGSGASGADTSGADASGADASGADASGADTSGAPGSGTATIDANQGGNVEGASPTTASPTMASTAGG